MGSMWYECTIDHMGVEIKMCIVCMIRVSMCVSMQVSVHVCWDTVLQLDNLCRGGGGSKTYNSEILGCNLIFIPHKTLSTCKTNV